MITLDEAIETVLQLPREQQEVLIKILQNRHLESRRAEIAADAEQSLADFYAGLLQLKSANEVIAELKHGLQDNDS